MLSIKTALGAELAELMELPLHQWHETVVLSNDVIDNFARYPGSKHSFVTASTMHRCVFGQHAIALP
jgi:hypothetical protein